MDNIVDSMLALLEAMEFFVEEDGEEEVADEKLDEDKFKV